MCVDLKKAEQQVNQLTHAVNTQIVHQQHSTQITINVNDTLGTIRTPREIVQRVEAMFGQGGQITDPSGHIEHIEGWETDTVEDPNDPGVSYLLLLR